RPLEGDVAEVMPVRGLVPAAEDDRHGAALQDSADDLPQGLLALLEGARGADIAQVERWVDGQINPAGKIARRQSAKELANEVRSLGSSRPAPIAAHALVLGEADEHPTAGV